MLRITGGEWRNRSIRWLDIPEIRPTSAKVREALFQVLAGDLPGARCWDLCAGSGVMGFEALSRGALAVTFVERNRKAAGLIRQNLEKLGVSAPVIPADVLVFLRRARSAVDLVFIDPPYASPLYGPLLEVLDQTVSHWGSGQTRLLLEHRRAAALSLEQLRHWRFEQTRLYGDTAVSLLRQREDLP